MADPEGFVEDVALPEGFVSDDDQRKQFAQEKKSLQRQRFLGEQLQAATGAAEDIARVASIPTRPILKLPEVTGTGVGAGALRVGKDIAEAASAPAYWMLPGSRVLRAVTAGQMAGNLPQSIPQAIRTIRAPETTTAEKIEAGAQPVLEAAGAGALAGVRLPKALRKSDKAQETPQAASEPAEGVKVAPEAEKPALVPPAAPKDPSAAVPEPAAPVPPKPEEAKTAPPVVRDVPPGSVDPNAIVPAIRLIGGKVIAGEAGDTHPDIIKREFLRADKIDQRGFSDPQGKQFFLDREAAEKGTQVPTEREPGRLHSTDLTKAQEQPKPPTAPETAPVGMGGAAQKEIPETGAGGEKHGIAQRVREERAQAGQTVPIAPGEGVSAPEAVAHGRTLLQNDPQAAHKATAAFDANGAISYDGIAATRAKGEEAFQSARSIEERFGTDSPEYRNAFEGAVRWDEASKKMQTAWHKAGQAQQGETDLDTGTFTGLQRAFHQDTGRMFTDPQAATAKRIAQDVTDANAEVGATKQKLASEAAKLPGADTGGDLGKARGQFGDYKPGSTMTPQQVKALWNYAKAKYIDKAMMDFDDIRHGLATDFGLSVADVTKGLAQPKAIRTITNDLYRRLSRQRQVQNSARNWLKDQAMPGWQRFARLVPKAFFVDATFGHGTVGMVTHAGLNMFNPGAWSTYWPNFLRQFKLLGIHDQGAYHERMMRDLVRDSDGNHYTTARRAGLANDPFKFFDDYQNNEMVKWFKKFGLAGNRGFDALKLFRQARFNQEWNKLPETLRTKEYAGMLADRINHVTGVVNMPFREWANWTFFAPKLESARWAWMFKDPVNAAKTFLDWNNASLEARHNALSELKQKAAIAGTYFGALALNQGILTAMGSDQKINFTDPKKADFLTFKVAGHRVGVVGPMLGMVRLFANMLHAAFQPRGKVEKLAGRWSEFGEIGADYARGKLSPFASFGADMLSGVDIQGRPLPSVPGIRPESEPTPKRLRQQGVGPYTYGEYAGERFFPIPVAEALREVWKEQGITDEEGKIYLNALLTGVAAATGIRITTESP